MIAAGVLSCTLPLGAHAASRSVTAEPAVGRIVVDGVLDEPAWTAASPQGDFWQRAPQEGVPPNFRTEFRVLYGESALYVGVRAHDPEPDKVRGLLTRRDEDSSSDWLAVGIDSYHDRRTAFSFWLNPAGVQRDVLMFDDVQEDSSWNAVWEGASRVDSGGWAAEFRIPYSQLRFTPAEEQVWGIQVARVVQRTQETSYWTPLPSTKSQVVSLFGEVTGIRYVDKGHRIELRPYAIGGARLADDNGAEYGAGLDFEVGLTSNLTVSGTINPDFGQVEADPSEVNLSAQETFFAEKRPFFLEGSDIFRFGLSQGDGDNAVEQLFYSRRIGAPPFAGTDETTTIYGATKLSGKTDGGWSIGALSAVTAQEVEQDQVVEPLTNYSVLRLKKDYNGGRTNIGIATTGVHRKLGGTELAADLHSGAYTGGLQLSHRTAGGAWSYDAKLFASHVRGDPGAILSTQRASQRYFQRPDADHVEVDATRTSLSGFGLMGTISHVSNKHWRGAVGLDSRSPGFEANDLGFQRGADYATNWIWAQLRDESPGGPLQNYYLNANGWAYSDWSPELLGAGGNVNGSVTFTNYWGVHAGVGYEDQRKWTGLLRGGPSVRAADSISTWFSGWSDSRSSMQVSVNGNTWVEPATDSWQASVNLGLNLQLASNLELSAGPFANARSRALQYVDVYEGDRYLLARLEQRTVGMTLRVNYTVSPELSLQAYAQPFITSGAFDEYKQPAELHAADFDDRFAVLSGDELGQIIGFERPDFNFRQLRSNVVVRWEYLPGSTLFAIWSHNRESSTEEGRLALGSDLDELASVAGEHVLLLKLTYWWAG